MDDERWGAVAVALACACAAGTAAMLGAPKVAHIPWLAAVAAGLALAGLTVLVGLVQKQAVGLRIFQAACWLLAGGWVAVCYARSPLHAGLWFGWAVASVVAMVAAYHFAPDRPAATGQTLPSGAAPASLAQGGDVIAWTARLARVTDMKTLVATAITPWPTGAGYDVDGHGSASAAGWTTLKRHEEGIANSLDLPHGCGVEVQPGPTRGTWKIRVGTVDTLATARTYDDTSELTVNGPLPLGWLRDGTPVAVHLRRECMTITAKTDGGKTNCLHTVVAGLVRCSDTLVWAIDLAGGGLILPWLAPWLDGQAEAPAIDYAATTEDEALLMTELALQIIGHRRQAYHLLMRQHNMDIVPISALVPEIVIALDESASAAGDRANPKLRDNLIEIVGTGRTTAVRVVMSSLRMIGSNVPTDLQSNIGTRVLFGVGDEAEVGYALGWRVRLDPTAATHPGCGWIRLRESAPIEVFRTLHTSPPRVIDRIAIACAGRRPDLDAVSLAVPLGRHYQDRWPRTLAALTGESGEVPVLPQSGPVRTAESGSDRTDPASPVRRSGSVSGMDLDGWTKETREARRKLALDGTDARFAELAGELAAPDDADPEAEALRALAAEQNPRVRMLAILDAAGPTGLSGPKVSEALAAAGLDVPVPTLYRWLKADTADGGYGVWIHRKYRPNEESR